MKAAVDVHWRGCEAVAACVTFVAWRDAAPREQFRVKGPAAAPYRPGRFFERELPLLLKVLDRAGRPFRTIVIDGYVHLRPCRGKGLGMHLYEALPYRTAVIGVAKNLSRIADRFVPILRGRSRRPLYVSAVGCPLERAAQVVAAMHGPHRLPTLLRAGDRPGRE
jgi:deoxyribonuclease V